MKSSDAIRDLIAYGWTVVRTGKGSHVILERDGQRIVVSAGGNELSLGMAGKVRSALRKR